VLVDVGGGDGDVVGPVVSAGTATTGGGGLEHAEFAAAESAAVSAMKRLRSIFTAGRLMVT